MKNLCKKERKYTNAIICDKSLWFLYMWITTFTNTVTRIPSFQIIFIDKLYSNDIPPFRRFGPHHREHRSLQQGSGLIIQALRVGLQRTQKKTWLRFGKRKIPKQYRCRFLVKAFGKRKLMFQCFCGSQESLLFFEPNLCKLEPLLGLFYSSLDIVI